MIMQCAQSGKHAEPYVLAQLSNSICCEGTTQLKCPNLYFLYQASAHACATQNHNRKRLMAESA